ncbi:autotransporter domain-containing protein [Brevundimonas terrae]|uniref:Autotransporter domain-containing protein n=1 Tax=Brevundimonas terrae TaxID=363631 RepID=A0ABN0YJJ8_9CAUL|nr:autotransporter-associated beta strand repeat-containing protein [Brevundimonas terrae]NIJ26971.1 outer membrane autotransporter protein [Brevundimonas terrae]
MRSNTEFEITTGGNQTIGSLVGQSNAVVNLGANTLTIGTNNSHTTFAGIIKGTGGLTKTGSGTLTLSGENVYTGKTTINAGTLSLGGSGAFSGSSAVNLGSGATLDLSGVTGSRTIGSLSGSAGSTVQIGAADLTIANASDTTFAGNINGSGTFNKTGSGALTLTGANAFTGNLNVYSSTLRLSSGGSLSQNSNLNLTGNSTFDIRAAGNQTIGSLEGQLNSLVELGANTLTIAGNNGSATFEGTISGTGGLTKNGSGTLTLTGTNIYSGNTTINAGTLSLSGSGTLSNSSAVSLGSGATLDLSSVTNGRTIGSLSGLAGSTVKFGASALAVKNARNTTFAGTLTGDGQLEKSGTGTLILTGTNHYDSTAIYAGSISLADAGSLNSGNSVWLYNSGAIFDISAADGDRTIGTLTGNAGTLVVLGDNRLTVNSRMPQTYFSGTISGNGGLTKAGAGSLLLTGQNSYKGQTIIENGTLELGSGASLSSQSGISLTGATAKLAIGGSHTIGSLSGVAGSQVELVSHTLLTMGGDNTSTTFAGKFNDAGFSNTIVKTGAGQLTLSGDNSSSNNRLIVQNGALVMAGLWGGSVQVDGGFLQFGQTAFQNPAYAGLDHRLRGDLNINNPFSTLYITGRDTLTVAGEVNFEAYTNLLIHSGASGPSLIADSIDLGWDSVLTISGINDGDALPKALIQTTNGITGDFRNVSIGGFAGSVDYMTLHSGFSADRKEYLVEYDLSWTANNALAHGTFTLSDASNRFVLGADLSDQAANFWEGWTGKTLTKAGKGTLVLTGHNTYTGGTTITDGTLQLGDGGTTGSVVGNITNNGTLVFNRSDYTVFGNHIFGSGDLVKEGGNTLILSGINTYTGGTTIRDGAILITQDAALGSGALTFDGGGLTVVGSFDTNRQINLNQNGLFNVSALQTLGLDGLISGTGALVLDGSGTLKLTGANTYSGGTNIVDGTLIASTVSLSGPVRNAGTLVFDQNSNAVFADTLSGLNGTNGLVLKRGSGTLTLTGQSDLDWQILAGGLAASSGLFSGSAMIDSASHLSFTDSATATYADILSGTGRFNMDGTGSVLMTGDSSGFGGSTFINNGTLLVGDASGQGSLGGSFSVLDGATLGGSGTIGSGSGSTVTIASGATLSPGNSIGTLNVDGNLVLDTGAILNMEMGSAGASLKNPGISDRINVSGDLTLNGTLNLSQSSNTADGTFSIGYYRLMTYGGTLNGSGLTLGQSPALAGATPPQIMAGNGTVDLFVAGIGDDTLQHWQGGNGVWNSSNAQWQNQNGSTAAGWAGNHAVFRDQSGFNGGTITLDGAQSFKGLQFVDNGYRLEGTGSLVTDNAGSEIRVLADSATIAASISGTGGITKTQGGTLILSGTNSYSGGTTLLGGMIAVTQDANLGAASGELTFNGGALQINGTDFGRTGRDISFGTNGGILDLVEANHTLTLDGTLSGAGTLVKQGAGTLALTGQNSFGGIRVEAGKLIGIVASLANTVDLAASTSLSLTDTGNSVYAGTLSGLGQFNLDGAGTVLMTGNSSGFGGSTFVNTGTLLVGDASGFGSLGGSFSVLDGATLGGSGTLGSGAGSTVTIASGATLSPGNSIGTLTVNGDLLFQQGARFVVEVAPGGSDSDLVKVSGKATLGGTVAHIGANGNYDLRSAYTILSAGSLSGTFEAVTSDFAFLTPSLTYDTTAGNVVLELERNNREFASAAQSRNQVKTARAIESIGFNAGNAVYDAIAQMADDKTAIRSAFDQLSGEVHASAKATLIEDSRYIRNAANARIRSAFGDAGASVAPVQAYNANGEPVAVDATHDGAAFWAQGFGSWGSVSRNDSTAAMERSSGGVLMGGDVSVSNWRVGALAGYSRADIDQANEAATAVADNYHLGAYTGTRIGNTSVRAALAYSWHTVDATRSVRFSGFSDHLTSTYDATTFQAFAEVGHSMDVGANTRLEPFANLAHIRLNTDALAETGQSAALRGHSTKHEATFGTVGLHGEQLLVADGTRASLRGTLGWRHAFDGNVIETRHAFSAGDRFTIRGAPIAKDSAVIEAGLDLGFSPNTTLGLTYSGQVSKQAQDHGLNATFSMRF